MKTDRTKKHGAAVAATLGVALAIAGTAQADTHQDTTMRGPRQPVPKQQYLPSAITPAGQRADLRNHRYGEFAARTYGGAYPINDTNRGHRAPGTTTEVYNVYAVSVLPAAPMTEHGHDVHGTTAKGLTGRDTAIGGSVSPADHYFLTFTTEGNLAEIQLGQLVLQRSQDPDVRRVAQTIVDGHATAQKQVDTLARVYGVPLPSRPNAAQRETFARFSTLSGPELDRMYIAQQIQEHVTTVNKFHQHGTMLGESEGVKRFAQNTLPHVAGHTEELRRVARKVGVPEEFGRPSAAQLSQGMAPGGTSTAGSAALPAEGDATPTDHSNHGEMMK